MLTVSFFVFPNWNCHSRSTCVSDLKTLVSGGVSRCGPSLSLQVALIDLLTKVGLQPSGIVGHSVGELACGYADGSLTHAEAVLAAYWRGLCIKEASLPPGAMAAVGKTSPVSHQGLF